ncbi:type III-B CRISPR module RAMP protein Cmr1 [Vibrio cholerae]|nr:type III-B CRISPR module RAMP protein Cmr1 [Vibrio cholerae]EJL6769514.1 type III-B CRISPR module RAMP protein Cmr1 [Vibrio cholerae]
MRRQNNTIDLQGLKKELLNSNKVNDKWESYSCTLVTPMYGGGVKAGEVDKDMPIRASAIRGQLRSWWRIACGSKAPEVMRENEEAIWGGIGDKAAIASQVQIRVISKNVIMSNLVSSKKLAGSGVKYALGAADEAYCLPSGYNFVLEIRYKDDITSDQIKQVKESLRWWSSFGGVGAKTRRGFGAVVVDSIKTIEATEVETIGGKIALTEQSSDSAQDMWKKATELLYKFRQGRELGRNEGQGNRPGRSRWPEPDQLRRMSNKHKTNHEPEHKAGNVFPRAAFGMPIIFDFNDRSRTEPSTMTLLPKDAQRMGSPLIIRPYKNGAQWQAAALLLPNWKTALNEPLELSPVPKNGAPNHWPTSENERARLAEMIKPMVGKDGQLRANDPLSAFLDFFEKGQ